MKQKEIEHQITYWEKRRKMLEFEIKTINEIVAQIQQICNHKYSDGTSAVQDDAFAHPAAVPVCKICKK
jgi:hypothetical protein